MGKRSWIVGGIVIVLAAVSWRFLKPKSYPDLRPATDQHIASWVEQFEKQNALEFFESNGSFMNLKFPDQDLDQKVLLPLIQRIRQETGLEPMAVLMEDNRKLAGGMIVELPLDREKLKRLQTIFIESDEAFGGVILRQYGHKWMQFELLDEETAKAGQMENWDVEAL